ncbi:MAG: cytochrome B6, partial [Gammaproteobacteria bacterium]|nr:cytochrome B6 [Gammaproteobacteria bacterium]
GREITSADLGRYNVTGREEDKHVFKVPSLRNVALTAPYLHDGSAQTLEAAVAIMARYQLGRDIPTEDLQSIVAFLQSLSGEIPEIGATP